MKDKLNFYIDGSWVESESKERIEVINPANEELIGHITSGTKDDINKAVLAASKAFKTYQLTSKEDRIELLNNIITEYKNRYDDLVQTITEEMGAPIWLSEKAQASTGIKNLHETLDYYLYNLKILFLLHLPLQNNDYQLYLQKLNHKMVSCINIKLNQNNFP